MGRNHTEVSGGGGDAFQAALELELELNDMPTNNQPLDNLGSLHNDK